MAGDAAGIDGVVVSHKHQVVGVPTRPDLANLFPTAKRATVDGNELIVLPHGFVETKMLRNLGYTVPSPITAYDYEGGTPFNVQRWTAEMLTTNQRAYCLNGMGTGKTKAALWSWRFLNRRGLAKKLLVVAPLSTLNFTWGREIFATLPGVTYAVLHGTKAKRLKRMQEDVDIYIVNHDGVKVIWDELQKRTDIDTLVIDELAAYRNGMGPRSKLMRKVAARMTWAWGMTGSPTPGEPTDAWGQCMILTPHTVDKRYTRFRESVMLKITGFVYKPKDDATETVWKAMQPAVRFKLDDVVELPELIVRTVDIEMGTKQVAVYDTMRREAYVAVQNGEITAVNAGVVVSKLTQISMGYVYKSDGSIATLDNDKRLDALVTAINDADQKVIVFAPFNHALQGVYERLLVEDIDTAAVSGATPQKERDTIFSLFQNTSKYKVIAANPQTMSHGITLTAATTIIWFGPIADLEVFDQANARITRIGQKHKQQILLFQATPVEKRLYSILRAKQKVQGDLLEMFELSTADATTTS